MSITTLIISPSFEIPIANWYQLMLIAIRGFPQMGIPQHGWFINVHNRKFMNFLWKWVIRGGYLHFRKPPLKSYQILPPQGKKKQGPLRCSHRFPADKADRSKAHPEPQARQHDAKAHGHAFCLHLAARNGSSGSKATTNLGISSMRRKDSKVKDGPGSGLLKTRVNCPKKLFGFVGE